MRVRVKLNALTVVDEDSPRYDNLTEGLEYFVLGVDDEFIRVVNDFGEPILYPKRLFDICDNLIPPSWSFKQGEGDDYYLDPCRTSEPGFYEDYFWSSGDTQAQLKAHAALRAALEDAFAWGQEADRVVLKRDMERLAAREKEALAHPGRRW
jgi:hypothetical protein